MILEKIIDTILDNIEKVSIFTKDELKASLETCNVKDKPHCTFFLLKIRQNAKEIVNDFYNSIVKAEFHNIKDISMRGPSVSFNLNLVPYGSEILSTIINKNQDFGKCNIGNKKTVVIDFSSPNIAKIFHMGHFRTTILGNFLKKLYSFCGYNPIGVNYLGDWGKQFGLVLLGYEKFGSEEKLKKDPLRHLFDVYVETSKAAVTDDSIDKQAKKIFEMMEKDNDEKYMSQWRFFREISIAKYKTLYAKLGVEFDEYSGESYYEKSCKEQIFKLDFLVKNQDGSFSLDIGQEKNPIVLKPDGTTLYLTRDIAASLDRIQRYNADKLVWVVATEQKGHFESLVKILRKIGVKIELKCVDYGIVKGMSTRKGKVEFLEDILDVSKKIMVEQIEKDEIRKDGIEDIETTASILAISTLVIMDFSAKRIKGYEFDIEKRAKNVNGTGPYIQYAHCRLKSIEEKNEHIDLDTVSCRENEFLKQEEITLLLYKLIWFEKVVLQCLDDYEPNRLYTYLNDLCAYTNSINKKMMVKGVDEELGKLRLKALKCARITIGNALRLFGLVPLNKM